MNRRVTLKDIAEAAGVHYSTVSLALRGHRSIPAETQQRIQTLATEMGYCPDPLLSALVAHRDGGRRRTHQGNIAWLDFWEGRMTARQRYPHHWAGVERQAAHFGWSLDEIRLHSEGLKPDRIAQVLNSRGIVGAIIPPMPNDLHRADVNFQNLCVVSISHSLKEPVLHRVHPNHGGNLRLALREIHNLGYLRPGLFFNKTIDKRTNAELTSAVLHDQFLQESRRPIPPLIHTGDKEMSVPFRDWLHRYKPDVLITYEDPGWVCAQVEENGLRIPEDLGLFLPCNPDSRYHSWQIAHLDERLIEVGSMGADFLIKLIRENERGIPKTPVDIQIPGHFVPGKTLPPRV